MLKSHKKKFDLPVVLCVFIISLWPGLVQAKSLLLMEIAPPTTTDYVVTAEAQEFRTIAKLTLSRYFDLHPSCSIDVQYDFRHGSEDELYTAVKSFSKQTAPAAIVGLSRTNFARIAAKASVGTSLLGMSIGASGTKISEINRNFMSVAAPWTQQWDQIKFAMASDGCTPSTTIGVFDPSNPISSNLRNSFKSDNTGIEAHLNPNSIDLPILLSQYRCVFITLNLSQTERLLSGLNASITTKFLYGPGEWNMFDKELKSMFSKISKDDLTVRMPTGWIATANWKKSQFALLTRKQLGRLPSPLGVYFRDALLISLEFLCNDFNPHKYDSKRLSTFELSRTYTGIASSGNLLSPMHLIGFERKKGFYEVAF